MIQLKRSAICSEKAVYGCPVKFIVGNKTIPQFYNSFIKKRAQYIVSHDEQWSYSAAQSGDDLCMTIRY